MATKWFCMHKFTIPIILLVLLLLCPAAAPARSAGGHPDVWLKNEFGERISPDANSFDPYSPRQTCGGCHSYATITRGWHFRQGYDKPGAVRGLYARGLELAALPEPVAPKRLGNPLAEGLSAYDWIAAGSQAGRQSFPAAGWVMPGGGPLEYGRDKSGAPDMSRSLAAGELSGRSAADGDYSSRFTPDKLSHFRHSGVIEADCLICHFPGYNMPARNSQISSRNYRWAATAGAGLGNVRGAVFTPANLAAGPESPAYLAGSWNFQKRPVVEYNWGNRRLFTAEGKISGTVPVRNVSAANCLQCHALLDAAATGTSHAKNNDVHTRAGLQCTDCHALAGKTRADRLRHEISPAGNSGMKLASPSTCRGCHLEGKYKPRKGMPAAAKSPVMAHAKRFPSSTFHFTVISCTGCHSGGQGAKGGYLIDRSMGYPSLLTAEAVEHAAGPGALADAARRTWKPWTVRHDAGPGEMYFAAVPKVSQWFGQAADAKITPLRLDIVRKALANLELTSVQVKSVEGKNIKVKTVASEKDMAASLKALAAAGVKTPVFVSDRIYRLEGEKVVAAKDPVPHRKTLVNHDISRKAYGSGGCRECHADDAPFFTRARVTNIGRFLKEDYPNAREPNAVTPLTEWGLTAVPPIR